MLSQQQTLGHFQNWFKEQNIHINVEHPSRNKGLWKLYLYHENIKIMSLFRTCFADQFEIHFQSNSNNTSFSFDYSEKQLADVTQCLQTFQDEYIKYVEAPVAFEFDVESEEEKRFDKIRRILAEIMETENSFSEQAALVANVMDVLLSQFEMDEVSKKTLTSASKRFNYLGNYSKTKSSIWCEATGLDLNVAMSIADIKMFMNCLNIAMKDFSKSPFYQYSRKCMHIAGSYIDLVDIFTHDKKLLAAANKILLNHKNKNGIQSLIITPVQRLARWPLLLSELKKAWDAAGLENDNLAVSNLEKIFSDRAKHFNDRILSVINRAKTYFQKDLDFSLIGVIVDTEQKNLEDKQKEIEQELTSCISDMNAHIAADLEDYLQYHQEEEEQSESAISLSEFSIDEESQDIKADYEISIPHAINIDLVFTYKNAESKDIIDCVEKIIHSLQWKFAFHPKKPREHYAIERTCCNAQHGSWQHTCKTRNKDGKLTVKWSIPRHSDVEGGESLLRIFSILNDVMNVLLKNNIRLSFSINDIANGIIEANKNKAREMKLVKPKDCKIIRAIHLLQKVLANSLLSMDDAILLAGCLERSNLPKDVDLSLFYQEPTLENLTALAKHFSSQKKFPWEFFANVHLWQRIKLFSPCLGMKAHDGGTFSWNYTEWFFLAEAKFIALDTGELSIDLDDNDPYEHYYAEGAKNYSVFGGELLWLAPCINIQFSSGLSQPDHPGWHQAITFDNKTSQKIMDMGLVLQPVSSSRNGCVKPIIRATNNYFLAQQACRQKEKSKLKILPNDVIKLIFSYELGFFVAPQEKISVAKLSALNLFSARKHKIRDDAILKLYQKILLKILEYRAWIKNAEKSMLTTKSRIKWWEDKIIILNMTRDLLNGEGSVYDLLLAEKSPHFKGWDSGKDARRLVNEVKCLMGIPLHATHETYEADDDKERFRL